MKDEIIIWDVVQIFLELYFPPDSSFSNFNPPLSSFGSLFASKTF